MGGEESNLIEHEGTVKSIDEDGTLHIEIPVSSSCSSCHAQGYCGAHIGSDNTLRDVTVKEYIGEYKIGEEVIVEMKQILGLQAVWWAYIFPIVIMVALLFVGKNMGWEEKISALVILVSLVVYYLILFLKREKLSRIFAFKVRKK